MKTRTRALALAAIVGIGLTVSGTSASAAMVFPPVPVNDTVTTNPDTAALVFPLLNDSIDDGWKISNFTLVSSDGTERSNVRTAFGSAFVSNDNSVVIQPDGNRAIDSDIRYTARASYDGGPDTASQDVWIDGVISVQFVPDAVPENPYIVDGEASSNSVVITGGASTQTTIVEGDKVTTVVEGTSSVVSPVDSLSNDLNKANTTDSSPTTEEAAVRPSEAPVTTVEPVVTPKATTAPAAPVEASSTSTESSVSTLVTAPTEVTVDEVTTTVTPVVEGEQKQTTTLPKVEASVVDEASTVATTEVSNSVDKEEGLGEVSVSFGQVSTSVGEVPPLDDEAFNNESVSVGEIPAPVEESFGASVEFGSIPFAGEASSSDTTSIATERAASTTTNSVGGVLFMVGGALLLVAGFLGALFSARSRKA